MTHLVSHLLSVCLSRSPLQFEPIQLLPTIKVYQLIQVNVTALIMGKTKFGKAKLPKSQLRAQARDVRIAYKIHQEVATSLGRNVEEDPMVQAKCRPCEPTPVWHHLFFMSEPKTSSL